jgi:hypothetical protein
MTVDDEQIIRQAYKIAENKDLEGWVAGKRIASFAAPVR